MNNFCLTWHKDLIPFHEAIKTQARPRWKVNTSLSPAFPFASLFQHRNEITNSSFKLEVALKLLQQT